MNDPGGTADQRTPVDDDPDRHSIRAFARWLAASDPDTYVGEIDPDLQALLRHFEQEFTPTFTATADLDARGRPGHDTETVYRCVVTTAAGEAEEFSVLTKPDATFEILHGPRRPGPVVIDAADVHRCLAYGREHAHEWGGLHTDGDHLLVLFTDDVDRHRTVLAALLDHPEHLEVRIADRTVSELEGAREGVWLRLTSGLGSHPAVRGVGTAFVDDRYQVVVFVDEAKRDTADEITRLARPEPLVIHYVDLTNPRSC